jgi:predicted RNA binding protein YcfA (HicA-like mRNA interferase family)
MPDGGRRLREVRASDALRALEHFGYHLDRIKGSHHMLYQKGQPPLVLPVHGGRIKAGIMRDALKKAGISVDEFEKYL